LDGRCDARGELGEIPAVTKPKKKRLSKEEGRWKNPAGKHALPGRDGCRTAAEQVEGEKTRA